jgi:transcription termination/antitermination protein NusG
MRIQALNETDPTPEERDFDMSEEENDTDMQTSAEPTAGDPVEAADVSVDEPMIDAAPETEETETAEPGAWDPGLDGAEPAAGPAAQPEESSENEQLEQEPAPSEPEIEAIAVEPDVAEAEPVEAAAQEVEPVEAPAEEADSGAAEPEPEPAETVGVSDDPFRGNGDWYVVHTYSGYENKVKANLESRIHTMQMEGKIFGVHIPMEDVMEIKSGKKQVVKKKQFPGYLLVRMIYDNDSWYVVRNTPGVTGFVSAGTGSKPTPLSRHEVEKILAVKKEEVRPQVRLGFEEGDVVRITSGPFADFNGTINEINPDQAKLKVLVNIFDRETPVELSFDQVSKV